MWPFLANLLRIYCRPQNFGTEALLYKHYHLVENLEAKII